MVRPRADKLGHVVVLAVAGVAVALATATLPLGCGGSGGGGGNASSPPPSPAAVQAPIPTTGLIPVTNAAPARRRITPADLPPPFATDSSTNGPAVAPRPSGAGLSVPPGFFVFPWADNLPGARTVTVAPNGDVFVVQMGGNAITVLRDADRDGIPETRSTFARGGALNLPFGLAFYPLGPNPAYIYVANTDGVIRYPYGAGDLTARGPAQTVVSGLPGPVDHVTRGLAFRPDGEKMYVSVGSAANLETGEDPRRAAILEFNPDGSGYRLFATGLRNPVSLAFEPGTNALWTVVNERDGLGDDLPPDFATHVTDGGFYGWPYDYIGPNADPRVPSPAGGLGRVLVPDVLIQAHSAPLGLAFYTGTAFPAAYRAGAFVSLHGSWNRSQRTGYKVIHVLPDGGYEDVIWGWALPDGTVWGRPVGVAVAADGSLLVSDDGAGVVWRLTYGLTPPASSASRSTARRPSHRF
jgi:glucose/arabinose dehydrogenase